MEAPNQSRSETAISVLARLAVALFLTAIPASVALHRPPMEGARLPAAALVRGASLTVQIYGGSARSPLALASVRIFWAAGERYFLAGDGLTDDRGRVAVTALPAGAAWVIVDRAGYARKSTALVLGGRERTLAVVLERERVVTVLVQDDAKKPIGGASILVTGTDALPFGAIADAFGRAAIGRLGRGPLKLRVAARGFEPETRSDILGDTTVTLELASVLDVRVEDGAHRPVNGAAVFIVGPSLWPARSVVTDANGHARIAGLESGAYDLKAEQGPLVSRTEIGVQIERGKAKSLTLVTLPGRMVPVIVTDGDGDHPVVVPNADVLLVEGGVSSFPIQGRTGRFGTVTLGPIPPGDVVAAARADGFVAHGAVVVPDPITTDVRVALVHGATLRGEVVDKAGHPIDGATIEVIGTDPDGAPIAATPLEEAFQRAHFDWALPGPSPLIAAGELGVMPGAIPAIPGISGAPLSTPMDSSVTAPPEADPWVTRFDGTFTATPVPPGRVRALVRHPSYVEATSSVVTLGPGASGTVRVVLSEGGALEGTVADEVGLPVAGARVTVSAMQGTLTRQTTTADDGTFAFATLPVDLEISVARPEEPFRPVLRRRIAVRENEKTELELTLPAPREPIEVSAEDPSGRAVPMAEVTVLSLDPEVPLRTSIFTDDAGRATLRDAAGLPLRIVVEAPGFARFAEQLDHAARKVAIDLVFGVIVEGHVTAVRGRRDVDGARVELVAEGHRRTALTDANGRYRFDDVSPGPAHLTVSHPDYAIAQTEIRVAQTGRADRAFDVDAIDLSDPGVVEGRVLDGDDRPVAGARIGPGVIAAYSPVLAVNSGTVLTKPDGTFRLERLPPGATELEAFLVGIGRGRATVAVDAGRTTSDVTIHLKPITDEAESAATGGVAVTLRETGAPGPTIAQVAPGSEAELAGLVAGDVLTAVDRVHPSSVGDARTRLSGPDGSDVVVEVERNQSRVSLRVRREKLSR